MKPTNKLDAYLKQINDGKITSSQLRIIERLKTGAQNIDTLCISLKMKYSTVTARLSELNDMGVVRCIHNPLARFSIYTLVTDADEQEAIAAERFADKLRAWKKVGEKQGYIHFL